ncbi:hypothetical protein [Pseudonocardia zijingensis]|uniref:hypothetical protein n=1 Tax=Pseudonocardia zijingensis TaxID=153376 RepID=UPI003608293E
MAANRELLALLTSQDGLITAARAAGCGLAERSLERRAGTEGWRRVAPRVFLAAGQRLTDRGRVRAAGLWAGERGAVSGPPRRGGTACRWWCRRRSRSRCRGGSGCVPTAASGSAAATSPPPTW